MLRTAPMLKAFLCVLVSTAALGAASCDDSDSTPVLRPSPSTVPEVPRDNREAEEAALWLSGELFVSDQAYETMASDLAAIRREFEATIPRVDIEFSPPWVSGVLLMGLTDTGVSEIRNGTFEALYDLNIAYHLASMDTSRFDHTVPSIVLTFRGRLHPERLAEEYAALDHIRYAEPNGIFGDRSNVYPWQSTGVRTYLFREAWGDCMAGCIHNRFWYFRVIVGDVEYVGSWDGQDPEPAWWKEAKAAYFTYRGWPLD